MPLAQFCSRTNLYTDAEKLQTPLKLRPQLHVDAKKSGSAHRLTTSMRVNARKCTSIDAPVTGAASTIAG